MRRFIMRMIEAFKKGDLVLVDESGKLRTIEDIHEEIWALVEPIL